MGLCCLLAGWTGFGVCSGCHHSLLSWEEEPQLGCKCRLEYFCPFSGLVPDVPVLGVLPGGSRMRGWFHAGKRGVHRSETCFAGVGVASGKENLLSARGEKHRKAGCRSSLVCAHVSRDRGHRGRGAVPVSGGQPPSGRDIGSHVQHGGQGNSGSRTFAPPSARDSRTRELEGSEVSDKAGAPSQHRWENPTCSGQDGGWQRMSGLDHWPEEKPTCLKRREVYSLDQMIEEIVS